MSAIDLTVVIPTYNRSARLVVCLEALARQSLPRERFAVIVVSDGSTDDSVAAARAAGDRLALRLDVLETDHGGPGHARNVGAARAEGAVLAFTDDDVRVGEDWLAAALPHFADPQVAGVEGRTDAETGAGALYRLNVSNTSGGIYPTCNMFYRRAAFTAVGGFDVRFRRAREDSDLAFRILEAGGQIVFEPRAQAAHRSHRRSLREPLFVASTLPDSVLLWQRHPGRDQLLPWYYQRSDAAKIVLAVAAAGLAVSGHGGAAAVAVGAFLALVARTMNDQLIWRRAWRPDRFLGLVAVYSLLPFAHVYYLAKGYFRVRRGEDPSSPA